MLYKLLHVLPRPQCLVSHSQNRTTYYHHHFPVYVCSSFQMWITRFEWAKISQIDSTVEEGKGVSAIIVISPFNISRSIIIVTFIWSCFKVCLLQFNQKYLNSLGAISIPQKALPGQQGDTDFPLAFITFHRGGTSHRQCGWQLNVSANKITVKKF